MTVDKIKFNKWFNIGALALWAFVCTAISLAMCAKPYRLSASLFVSYVLNPMVLLVNYLPFLILALLGMFAANRVWVGFATCGFLPMIFLYINYFKLIYRNEPFTMVDITLVGEAANMGTRYSYAPDLFVACCILLILAATVISSKTLKFKFNKKSHNICASIAVILAGILCFEFVYMNDAVYDATNNIERNSSFMAETNKNDRFVCRGFTYSFLHSASDLVQNPPQGYNAKQAKEILESYSDDVIPDDKKVNIISVMLEAYNDFSKFKCVKFTNNPYNDYYYVKSRSTYGNLFTNIFGGGTIDTERAFVTGFSYQYDYRYRTESYVSYLKSQGYTTEGGHPGHNWFYKRDAVNSGFGFDNYYFYENRYQQIYDTKQHKFYDGMLEDEYFFEDIISLYEQNKTNGKPYFNFSVSYQNHGPYDDTTLLTDKTYIAKTPGMSDETYNILNNYFAGIEKTGKACKNLVKWAESQQEPIMIVLFGDHNPWLGNGMNGYYELGINVNTATEDGLYNYYQTPYVIYANKAAKEVTGKSCTGYGGSFSPMFLMNKVFELNGWGGSRFMKISNQLKQYIDIVTYTGQVRENGKFTEYPSVDGFEALSRLKKVQYYIMDKK